jgi:hypothetical protein
MCQSQSDDSQGVWTEQIEWLQMSISLKRLTSFWWRCTQEKFLYILCKNQRNPTKFCVGSIFAGGLRAGISGQKQAFVIRNAEWTVVPWRLIAAFPVEAHATYAFLSVLCCWPNLFNVSIISFNVNVFPLPAGPAKYTWIGSISGVHILYINICLVGRKWCEGLRLEGVTRAELG